MADRRRYLVGDFRVVQLTPHHSACSISFGKGLTTDEPGSLRRLLLAVEDIDTAREDLISRGVEVSEVFHLAGGPVPGPDPQGRSYQTYASFSDPDGNGWLLQEIKTRLPGREWEDEDVRRLSGRLSAREHAATAYTYAQLRDTAGRAGAAPEGRRSQREDDALDVDAR